MIEITTLAERPEFLTVAAHWGYEEWGRPSGRDFSVSLEHRRKQIPGDGFERCLPLLENGAPAATASLVHDDFSARPDLTPWLASVYVHPAYRGRGFAKSLVLAVEQAARNAGRDTLWLYTSTAPGLYRSLGWQDHETVEVYGVPSLIMRRDLTTVIAALPHAAAGR